ncbi:MAG: O-methyltransferase [Saprospiraceae bacterium]
MFNNLTPSDLLRFLVWAILGLTGLFVTEHFLLGQVIPYLSLWLFACLVLALLFLIYRKLVINFNVQNQLVRDSFSQVSPLQYLHQILPLRKALPSMRGYVASPDFLAILADLVLTKETKTIVECGSGVSTIVNAYLLEKLNAEGHIYSLDNDAHYAGITRDNIAYHDLSDWATIVHAPIQDFTLGQAAWKWYATDFLKDLPTSIDLIVVDGPPSTLQKNARYPALPLLFDRLSPTACIIVDDCNRSEDKASVERWLKEYPDFSAQWYFTEKGTYVLTRK